MIKRFRIDSNPPFIRLSFILISTQKKNLKNAHESAQLADLPI